MNHRAKFETYSFILGRKILNHIYTHTHTHTHTITKTKQKVNDIWTPCPLADVQLKQYCELKTNVGKKAAKSISSLLSTHKTTSNYSIFTKVSIQKETLNNFSCFKSFLSVVISCCMCLKDHKC